MKVKELIILLSGYDGDLEVVVVAPDSAYYSDEYYEYPIEKEEIDISFEKLSIGVG